MKDQDLRTLSFRGQPLTHHWFDGGDGKWRSVCGLVARAGELSQNPTGWLHSGCGDSLRVMGAAALAWQDLKVNEVPGGVVPVALHEPDK